MPLQCPEYNANITLVFTKLAKQLTAEKLADLAVIPVIFIVQTLVSYLCAILVSKVFRFHKRAQNFVIAMAVCGYRPSMDICGADTSLDIWQLQFSSNLPRHLLIENIVRPSLGQDSR